MDSTVAEDIRNDNVRAAPESIENADSVFAIRNSGSITVTPAAGLPLHDGHDDDRPALEPRPFLQLREGWPQSALDTDGASDRSLVICTIDFQILTDTVRVMHAQIDLLRQTILRLRQDAAVRKVEEHDELEILRRKIVDLEKFPSLAATAPQGTAGVRLDKVESRLQELEKGRPISHTGEEAALAEELVQWQARLRRLESIVWGTRSSPQDTIPTGTGEVSPGGSDHDNKLDDLPGPILPQIVKEVDLMERENVDSFGAISIQRAKTDHAAAKETAEEAASGNSAEAEFTEGLGQTGNNGRQQLLLGEGNIAGAEDVTSEYFEPVGAAMSDRKRYRMKSIGLAVIKSERQPLCSTVASIEKQLNIMMRADQEAQISARLAALEAALSSRGGVVAAVENIPASLGRLLRQAASLRNTLAMEGLVAGAVGAEAGAVGNSCWKDVPPWIHERERAGENDRVMLEKARDRLAWIESCLGETTADEGIITPPSSDGESYAIGKRVKRQHRAGNVMDSTQDKEKSLNGPSTPKGSEDLVTGGGEDSDYRAEPSGLVIRDDEVVQLWRRMDEAERRVYRKIENHRRNAQVTEQAQIFPSSSSAALESRLQDLDASIDRSSTVLMTRLDQGLASLEARICSLENGLSGEERAAASAAAASTRESAADIINISAEMPLVRRCLEGVAERIAVLEAASTGEHADTVDSTLVELVAAAAQAARGSAEQAAAQAAERAEARILSAMFALEERVERRARDESRRAREEGEATEARNSMRRVSSTVSAYTTSIAARLDGLAAEHAKTGTDVARAAEEIATAEDGLRKMGEELLGLGQVANRVAMVVNGKVNQTDVEALKQTMLHLDEAVAKDRSGKATRESEAVAALQTAFKDMSASMEESLRKLKQAQQSAGSVRIKPLLDRIIAELSAAGLLPDPDCGLGAIGRSQCLSCNRPMAVNKEPSSFSSYIQGQQLGMRMATAATTNSQLHVNKPTVVWRGGFRMPPNKVILSQQQLQQQQLRQQQQYASFCGEEGMGRERGVGGGAAGVHNARSSSTSYGSRHSAEGSDISSSSFASDTQSLPDMRSLGGLSGRERSLPGIPHILDAGGGDGGRGVGDGIRGDGWRGGVGVRKSSDAPHRARFVQNTRLHGRRA